MGHRGLRALGSGASLPRIAQAAQSPGSTPGQVCTGLADAYSQSSTLGLQSCLDWPPESERLGLDGLSHLCLALNDVALGLQLRPQQTEVCAGAVALSPPSAGRDQRALLKQKKRENILQNVIRRLLVLPAICSHSYPGPKWLGGRW